MGTYKANKNNVDNQDIPEKSEKEKKQESTEKAVDLAAETALDVYTGGKFSELKGKAEKVPIVGNAVNKTWDKSVKRISKVSSKTPIGDIAKQADDAGITDAAKDVKGIMNMKNGQPATSTGGSSNASSGLTNLFNKNSSNNDIMGSLFQKMPTSLKIKLILGLSVVFLFSLICIAVFANDDIKNLSLTNNTNLTSKSGGLTLSHINSRIVYLDLDNLVINNNIENPIYVINIIDGFSLEEINNLINNFITTNSIEDYFVTNSSSSINDNDLYSLYDNRFIIGNDISQSIINSGLVKSVGVGEAATINLSDRISWLFPEGLPKSKSEMDPYLTTINVEVSDINGNISTKSLTLHKNIASEVEAIFSEMAALKFPIKDAYAYSWREMASNKNNRSHHSYGVAIDINADSNPAVYWGYSPNKNDPYYINQTIVEIWKSHGFYWGGDWSENYYDPMHFTYTNH